MGRAGPFTSTFQSRDDTTMTIKEQERRNVKRRNLIDQYMPIVKTIVLGYERKLPPHISVDDLVNAGVVGLIAAVDNYDPERDDTFGAYAAIRIKCAIINELRQWDHLSRVYRQRVKQLEETYLELEKKNRRVPREDEIKEHLGFSDEQFKAALENSSIRFMSYEDTQVSERNLVDEIFIKEAMGLIQDAFGNLSFKMRRTLELYYFEGKKQSEIAKELNVSETRVSQLRKKALEDLQPVRKLLEDVLYL
jgi:RNA polymerase sigma factor FliA